MTKKNQEPSSIEEAIGDRAKPKGNLAELPENAVLTPVPQNPTEIPDEPTPSEMLTLEELNRQTEERLQDRYPEENLTQEEQRILNQRKTTIPVSKPDLQPPQETSSLESPPQKTIKTGDEFDKAFHPPQETLDFVMAKRKNARYIQEGNGPIPLIPVKLDEIDEPKSSLAEDVELTTLKKYIREDGFVLATVAFHIVTLCAEPMTTPSTTTWDFKDRASVPDMVLALLNQPGYLESIWPSLKIVMGSNIGNAAWCAGIATTLAFFDTIRVIPTLKELQIETV